MSAYRCPECGSDDVTICKPHPTVRGWHINLCNSCGHESGDHRVPNWAQRRGTRKAEHTLARSPQKGRPDERR